MNWPRSHDPVFLIVVRSIELQRFDALGAFVSVEPASRQQRAHGLYAVLNAKARCQPDFTEAAGFQPQVFQGVDAADTCAELAGLRVMRQDMARIDIGLSLELTHVMPQVCAGGLVVVDDVNLFADLL